MTKFWRVVLAVSFIVAMVGSLTASAATVKIGENPSLTEALKGDVVMFGNAITVSAPVAGELVTFGSAVTITQPVERSLVAGGSTVSVTSDVGYNAFLSGTTVTITGTIGHDAFVAAESVVIEQDAKINGDLRVAANSVTLKGMVAGSVYLGAQSVASSGVIGGSVSGNVEELVFSGGTIGGNLKYSANNDAEGLDKVTVAGTTQRQEPNADHKTGPLFEQSLTFVSWLLELATMLLFGAVLLMIFPKKLTEVEEAVSVHWSASLAAGVISLVAGPILVGIFFGTVIGWPVALLILFAYIAYLVMAIGFAPVLLGRWLLKLGQHKETAGWWNSLLLGTVTVAVLSLIPVIRDILPIVVFVGLTLPIFGGLLLWTRKQVF